eukprot:2490271-Ditylum_brightwellii.AAC.1
MGTHKVCTLLPKLPKAGSDPTGGTTYAKHYPHGKPEALQPTTLRAVSEETYGMSKIELHQTLKLCGLQQGNYKSLPEWFKIITEKGQNDNTRNQAIVQALQNTIQEDAEISITSQLLTTTHNR